MSICHVCGAALDGPLHDPRCPRTLSATAPGMRLEELGDKVNLPFECICGRRYSTYADMHAHIDRDCEW